MNIECFFVAADIIRLVVGFERMTVGWRREVCPPECFGEAIGQMNAGSLSGW